MAVHRGQAGERPRIVRSPRTPPPGRTAAPAPPGSHPAPGCSRGGPPGRDRVWRCSQMSGRRAATAAHSTGITRRRSCSLATSPRSRVISRWRTSSASRQTIRSCTRPARRPSDAQTSQPRRSGSPSASLWAGSRASACSVGGIMVMETRGSGSGRDRSDVDGSSDRGPGAFDDDALVEGGAGVPAGGGTPPSCGGACSTTSASGTVTTSSTRAA
jgi:hypothetical protein